MAVNAECMFTEFDASTIWLAVEPCIRLLISSFLCYILLNVLLEFGTSLVVTVNGNTYKIQPCLRTQFHIMSSYI